MPLTPEEFAHKEWLGYVQPTGLVVSVPALLAAQAQVDRNIVPVHRRFLDSVVLDPHGEEPTRVRDFPAFTRDVLSWRESDLVGRPGGEPLPADLETVLPEYDETLRPTYAVRDVDPADPVKPWMMLIQELPAGTDLDRAPDQDHLRRWPAPPHAKFERLLRETQVAAGLLVNGTQIRLVYAPRGETSGYATFDVGQMAQVAGRPIFAALHMLLSADRLFSLPARQRLPWILAESRKYQNTVSTRLAGQVLAALFELLRGFQAADERVNGELLRDVLAKAPNHVYQGLLTVLMRLVFLLYAEDRALLSSDRVYVNHYGVTGLFERLRGDAARHPDTMKQRYGAWAQLLTLFRLIYDGGSHGTFRLPARRGDLFDPDKYNFLEGRPRDVARRHVEEDYPVPHVPDGTVYEVLRNLLVLDGERLSYRTLDVEQIGSVYEAVMGFRLEIATGRGIAIKPAKPHGAPATIDLDALLATKPADRNKWLKDRTDKENTGRAADALKAAATVEDLLAAIDRRIDRNVTPDEVRAGAMVLQPSDERRRSGAHYTPRSLTEPIVRKTFEPILARLGEKPTPEQILDLKVCDPAMGSGAFLVAAGRQLGEELVKAWHAHGRVPKVPPDEDELLHARRLVAQRCLYGVDKNSMAVVLAKLSLWLDTLAKDHPFTFVDHTLRAGDSLVGLTRRQILAFSWEQTRQKGLDETYFKDRLDAALAARREILDAGDEVPYLLRQQKLAVADERLALPRLVGDLAVSAFFAGKTKSQRKQRREELREKLEDWLTSGMRAELREPLAAAVADLRGGEHPVEPFHWEIEFPEVFGRANGGFDAFVGNPPFAGKTTISEANAESFPEWIKSVHSDAHGNADLVAHFFRRAFDLLRSRGTFGLIATNTIAQGDTRNSGLRWICEQGGTIYAARRRYRWPGQAAVVVSIVHVAKSQAVGPPVLDGHPVERITAYLFHQGGNEDPDRLRANERKSFQGSITYGMGFTFDDDTEEATPIRTMNELIARNPSNGERILPFLGGDEVNNHPRHEHRRYVIFLGELTEREARRWPDLMRILEAKVKPERAKKAPDVAAWPWWQFWRVRSELYDAIAAMERVLVINCGASPHMGFAFVSPRAVFAHSLDVFSLDNDSAFCVLQCQAHEVWARFFASSLEDRLRYTPSDCFETFPFPAEFESNPSLEAAGKAYYVFRADLMVRNDEGLTKTYNRFHDPDETSPDIARLRELHAAMDRAVLDAYGWTNIRTDCEFLLDYEEEDDEDEETGRRRTRKKPWRYRWPDDVRDEVLARLLALNRERAEQERLTGIAGDGAAKKGKGRKKAASEKDSLF